MLPPRIPGGLENEVDIRLRLQPAGVAFDERLSRPGVRNHVVEPATTESGIVLDVALPNDVREEVLRSEDLIKEHPEAVLLVITDRHDDHTGRLQEVSGEQQAALHVGQPLRGLGAVVGVDVAVVVDPALVARVVRRVDVDETDLAAVSRPECLERVEVLAVDDGVPGRVVWPVGDALHGPQAREDRLTELADDHEVADRSLASLAVEDGHRATGVGEACNAPGVGGRLVAEADFHALADRVVGQPDRLG